MQQHSSSSCIWSIYLSDDTIFQSLWFLSGFLDRVLLLTRKLLNQEFLLKLKSSFRMVFGPHHDSDNCYGISVSQMTTNMFHFPVLSSFMAYHRVYSQISKTGSSSGAGTAYPSRAPEFIPVFSGVRITQSFVLCLCMFCRSLLVLLCFFFWPLCCLFFFDLLILITPLVSSNSCYANTKFCLVLFLCQIVKHLDIKWDMLISNLNIIHTDNRLHNQ